MRGNFFTDVLVFGFDAPTFFSSVSVFLTNLVGRRCPSLCNWCNCLLICFVTASPSLLYCMDIPSTASFLLLFSSLYHPHTYFITILSIIFVIHLFIHLKSSDHEFSATRPDTSSPLDQSRGSASDLNFLNK